MKEQDLKAFSKWVEEDSLSPMELKLFRFMTENQRIMFASERTWIAACEYKDAQYRPRYEESEDAIYINGRKFYGEKIVKELESERINKLIETLEWIASMRYDACWRNDGCTCLVDSAAIALAEYKAKEGGE